MIFARASVAVQRLQLRHVLLSPSSTFRVRELANGVNPHLFPPLPRGETRRRSRPPLDGSVALFAGSLDSAHSREDIVARLQEMRKVGPPIHEALQLGDRIGPGGATPGVQIHVPVLPPAGLVCIRGGE